MQAQNPSTQNLSSTGYDRRSFLKTAGLGALAMNIPIFDIPDYLQGIPMGVVVHSYGARWHSKANSSKYPGFQNALDLIAHCKEIGAGGVQVGVNGWASDFAKKVREARENSNLYLEGSIGLPRSSEDLEKFEQEIIAAKEAGVEVLRTVCLNGRRYEDFDSDKDFLNFKAASLVALSLAEPIVRKRQVKLAVENHKDWKASELAEIIQNLGSEWVGVTVDFGNNVALLEDPNKVIETLAPMAFSTHVKDMGVKEYQDGFLLSEVPLGKGIVDLEAGISLCKKYNPNINFSLEMITRDPLEIPVLNQEYWATMGSLPAAELAKMLKEVKENTFDGSLPSVSELNQEQRLAFEEENVIKSLSFSKSTLGLG